MGPRGNGIFESPTARQFLGSRLWCFKEKACVGTAEQRAGDRQLITRGRCGMFLLVLSCSIYVLG